jgi:hypothetical protein
MSTIPALGYIKPPIQQAPWALFPEVKRQGREADHTHLQVVSRSRNCGYTHPLPHTPSWRRDTLPFINRFFSNPTDGSSIACQQLACHELLSEDCTVPHGPTINKAVHGHCTYCPWLRYFGNWIDLFVGRPLLVEEYRTKTKSVRWDPYFAFGSPVQVQLLAWRHDISGCLHKWPEFNEDH